MSEKDRNTGSTLPPEQQPQGMHIGDLRRLLFDTINGIKSGSMRIEQAKMVSDISQVIINSAKVEVDFIKATGGKSKGSGFMDKPPLTIENEETPPPPALPAGTSTVLEGAGLNAEQVAPGVTRYRASNE